MNILVTGANGQLGNEMRRVSKSSGNHYVFTDVAELDITDLKAIRRIIDKENIQVIVNCAAYTNVDKAEDDYATADLLNNKAVENLSIAAKESGSTLIPITFLKETGISLVTKIGRPIRWEFTESQNWQEKKPYWIQDAVI